MGWETQADEAKADNFVDSPNIFVYYDNASLYPDSFVNEF
jgi:hypothetical protein